MEVVSQHVHAAPPSPRAENSAVPVPVESLILRLLAKEREGRPASADAVAEELASIAAGLLQG